MAITLSVIDSALFKVNGSTYTREQYPLNFPFQLEQQAGVSCYHVLLFQVPNDIQMKKCDMNFNISITSNAQDPTDITKLYSYAYIIDNSIENILTSDRFLHQNTIPDTNNMNWCVDSNNSNNLVFWPIVNGSNNEVLRATGFTTIGKYIALNIYGKTSTIGTTLTINSASVVIDNIEDFNFITSIYPVNVNISKTANQIFSWDRSDSVPDDLSYSLPIQKHSVNYKVKGTDTVYTLTENDSNSYQEISANTFNTDTYQYQIVDYTYYDLAVYSNWYEFNAIGTSDAPTINSVSDDNIPTVSWTDSNQAAFEVRIKNTDQTIVYYSGMIAGNDQSYQITEMLDNGTYIVEVRELNTYGFYSDWGSLEFTINPATVSAPTDIFATVNNQYGVEISGTPAVGAQATYVIRRKVGETDFTIIGIYTGGIYTDYTAEGNVFYEYSLRNYNVGYADGELVPLQVKVKEVVIQDGRDLTNYLDLSLSDEIDFNSRWIEEKDRTLYNCLGRIYPVKEPGEWVNSSRTFTAFVNESDRSKLHDLNLNAPKVYYKADKEYFACDMTIEDEGPYVGGGRLVTFTLTRIADDEGVSII